MDGVKGIILMAGSGERFSSDLPKQFHPLNGKPIYLWTLIRFIDSKLFDEILLVVAPDQLDRVTKEVPPEIRIIQGGETRQESSCLALQALSPDTKIVVIHDAVRPFVSQRILKENVEKAKTFGAVDTCIPSADTIVHSPDGKTLKAIPPRHEYMRGQTPQSFAYPLILEAHQRTSQRNATDDCTLALEQGHDVHIVLGDEKNHKITTKEDLVHS